MLIIQHSLRDRVNAIDAGRLGWDPSLGQTDLINGNCSLSDLMLGYGWVQGKLHAWCYTISLPPVQHFWNMFGLGLSESSQVAHDAKLEEMSACRPLIILQTECKTSIISLFFYLMFAPIKINSTHVYVKSKINLQNCSVDIIYGNYNDATVMII